MQGGNAADFLEAAVVSWSDCGKDSTGRPIGYGFPAECDHPGCKETIDRGLAYVCGLMHGSDKYSCERYFCQEHRSNLIETRRRVPMQICDECFAHLVTDGDFRLPHHPDFEAETAE